MTSLSLYFSAVRGMRMLQPSASECQWVLAVDCASGTCSGSAHSVASFKIIL